MSNKKNEIIKKESLVQAIVVDDTFDDEFVPISDDIPHYKFTKNREGWTITMKVNIIVSESCHSFGDCLRDLDAKGLLSRRFCFIEPGTVSNIQLLPLIKKHNETVIKDKGAAMTILLQEAGIGYEIFLDNPSVSVLHNLKDTHIAICSSPVLPLFSDNFDFQTKDDFVGGLIMNEEILGSTVYYHVLKGSQFGRGTKS
ncbi:hypothetical protein NQ317_012455 [Molorchus minor]|uniref:Uncharacterized protein n=1 Tax=Molorchus minor TaxID=1323400 RepID=A0ABQ9JBE7_9CUCU|nr:hypothetical protein NQ317_012455 [Molorchus minor]